MAAEVPVCDVLFEATEYLSKLGTNLRTRSESLKEKRISKNKLRNAHAVHKAAEKVLLLCELSKKSLENVETGVRKVLAIVDASQAHTNNGGKIIDKNKQEHDDKFYYFEYDSCKLRISKKVPVKHFMSVKVLARSMPPSMQEKYPVFYDCKLKRLRKKQTEKQCEDEVEINSQRRYSNCSSDTNHSKSKSKEHQKHSEIDIESDASRSGASSKNEKSRNNSIDTDKTKTNRRKSRDKITKNNTTDSQSLETQDDNSQGEETANEQESLSGNVKGKEDSSVSELIECFANVAKVNDDKTICSTDKKVEKGENSVRKKFSKIRIVDDDTDSDESLINKHKDSSQSENQSSSKENKENLEKSISEPKTKKQKLSDTEITSKSKEDDDRDSIATNDSDTDQKELRNDSKPLIRCVNITKLLKPDVIGSKIGESLNGKEISKSKPQLARKTGMFDRKNNNKQKELREATKLRKSSNDKKYDLDEEFWMQKRKEVKLFKPKQFSININRLPHLTTNFLLTHKLQKIIQGCKTICEVSNIKNKEIEQLVNNINEVKNALLNESGSEDNESVSTAEARNVKKSLLNDSDSESGKKDSQNTEKSSQMNCEKLTDPAAIKDALLNESDTENNENNEVIQNKACDSIAKDNEKEIAEKIKSSLLDDSDSDRNENRKDENINPASKDTTDGKEMSQSEEKVCDEHSDTIDPAESTQDPETIKSSLLNDSSDSHSDSPVAKIKKRKLSRHKRKHAIKSIQAKKMLLNHSSSSENEEHSQELDKDSKHAHKHRRRKSRVSSSSSSSMDNSKKKDSQDSNSQDKSNIAHSSDEDNRNKDQVDGTIDEHSDSSVSKVRT